MTFDEETEARLDAFAAAGGFRMGRQGPRRVPTFTGTAVPPELIHDVPLTGGRTARLQLPTDLTLADADRLARFMRVLAVDWTPDEEDQP